MKRRRGTARYALRRTLPPWCFDERLEELLEFCRNARVDEVIVKVDTEEFSHGIPTVDWLQAYMPMLERARDAVAGMGVAFSINPWVTVGHLDRGRDLRSVFPDFDWMVGHRGEECRACACPLSPAWREHTKTLWRMYASLEPNVIWVEDDIRTFNHTPIDFGCFCDLHMTAFSERVGEEAGREKLVEAILRPGKPHPWREIWLDLLRDVILDTCRLLAKAVHEVSPETCLGLMSSGAATHCIEGRNWKRLAGVLGDGKPMYSRATLGNYNETSLTGLYYSAAEIKRARYLLPPGIVEQTEVENAPFTAYSKSAAFTFLQIALSVSHGCSGATLNLFDHVGTPMSIDPDVLNMLREKRSFIDALAESHSPPGVFRGVRILHHERAGYVRELSEGDDYGDLVPADNAWERGLNALGIATTCTESPVTAADGRMIAAYSDDEIAAMLSGGLLLDLRAAEVLIERGFGEHLGVSITQTLGLHDTTAISAEELTDPEFGGREGRYLTMSLPGLIGSPRFGILAHDGPARPISRLVDPDRKTVYDFTTIYENRLGGRIAVVPLEMCDALGSAFLHPHRRAQMLALLRWLSRDRLPVAVAGGVYPLLYRMDFPDRVMLGVFNLCHNDWPNIVWELYLPDGTPRDVRLLFPEGDWKEARAKVKNLSEKNIRITLEGPLSFRMPSILRLPKT